MWWRLLLPRSALFRYGMAVLTVGLALLFAWLVVPLTGEVPIEIFFTAVILSLWFGRLGPGLLALGLALLIIDFVILPPVELPSYRIKDLLRLSIFSFLTLLVYFLILARDRLVARIRLATAEMASAARVQNRLLGTLPTVPGFDLGARCQPVLATGGDYFDSFSFKGGAVGFVLGDVSGHGLGPALLAASARAYLRTLPMVCEDAGEILTLANSFICADTREEFVTVFLGRLDPVTRSLVYAGAGHPGYVLSSSGELTTLAGTGPPLGVNASEVYHSAAVLALETGQMIFLLSDGILEATSGKGKPFGLSGALEVIRTLQKQPAQNIAAALCQAAMKYSGTGKQKDDMTAFVIKVEAAC